MGTPKKSPLGKTTKSASTMSLDLEKKLIVERYYLQSLARELLPNHRICVCCRFLSHNAENVKIVYRPRKKSVGFKGLARCSCLWVCPVCGQIISETRKSELKRATNTHSGDILMLSYTLRHNNVTPLAEVLGYLASAFRNFFAGRFGEEFRERYDVLGTVRALEVTHGKAGWHPHYHQLIFTRSLSASEIDEITLELSQRWVTFVKRAGSSATLKRGLDVKKDADFVAGYVAKFGHAPTREIWSVEHELAKANYKKAKDGGRSPLELLADYGEGDKRAGRLFQEYAQNFFGKRQLVWSRGLKDVLGVDVLSDEEIVEKDEKDGNFNVLATLSGVEWRRVRELKFQAVLLTVALSNDAMQVEKFLIDNYIRSANDGTQKI